MRPEATNPFRDASFSELSLALNDTVRTLELRAFRTRQEKETFAQRLRFLLLAVAMRFRVGDSIPGTPEMELSRLVAPDVEASFMEWYRKQLGFEAARVRVMTLYRAADFVIGGKEASYWVVPTCPVAGKSRPIDLSEGSDDGLRLCLQRLAAISTGRGAS